MGPPIFQKYFHQHSKNIHTNISKIFTPIFTKIFRPIFQKCSHQYSKDIPTNISTTTVSQLKVSHPKIFSALSRVLLLHKYYHHHRLTIKSKSPKNILCSQQSATMTQII